MKNKLNLYKKLALQTILYSIGTILPKIINYAFLKFFTKSLRREEFSLYTDMYSLSFIVIGFLSFGLENTYFRFLSKRKEDKEIIFSTGVIIQFIITSLFLIFSIYSVNYLVSVAGYKKHPEYFFMFFLIIFFDTICILPMAWLRAHEKVLRFTMINVINILLQSFFIRYMFSFHLLKNKTSFLSFIFEFVNSLTDKTGFIFFANMISSFSSFILITPILLKKVNIKNFNKVLAKKMLNYGIPIMLGTLSFSFNENLDKIFIKRWLSDEINGAYSACYKIASFMNLYIRAFRLGIEPFFFKKSEDYDAKYYYEEIIYLFIILGLIFYVLICGNISILVGFLIDKKYHTAISIIPIVMMGNLFLGIYTNLSIFYKIIDKPIIGTYISLIGVFVTILFNIIFIFIPHRNFLIPAWGTLTSYGSMVIVLYFWWKKNFLKFYRKIWSVILHLILSVTLVSYIFFYESRIEVSLFLQLLYIILVFLFEINNFI
ncbi:lipopolysaccharide biosynthesis protein [Blattabacterium cuenoti]|uniref:lipopolysaccharide biosynthesis protein n=1 Tax=Blattabacterium cuenoti TaxID=1653831 RepID=UPI00163B9B20|nr:oligosaccharide flippase family protein [Blattabacterium cuenoti]